MVLPSWEESFENCDLGDKRRTKRVIKIANQIDSKCDKKGASAVLNGHGELKAASRLLNSSKVTPGKLTEGFMKVNCERISESHVLLVEDTSELNFAWRKKMIAGLGPTCHEEDQGFFIHPAIVVEASRKELLGIAGLSIVTRQHGQKTTEGEKHKDKDITEKESYRWIDVPRRGMERLSPEIKKTIVADREADIYDLFLSHHRGELGNNSELLIRASRNRKITGGKGYLYEEISSWDVHGTHDVTIDGNGKRKTRNAECEIRFGEVTIDIPKTQRYRKNKESVSGIFVIDICEKNKSESEERLHWRLLTTWPVHTVEEAIEKVEWYRSRWLIEELFRVLKSGYHVESVRFDDGAALINWCALRLLMAVKLMYIRTHRNDEEPDSARNVFSEIELKVLDVCEPLFISGKSTIHRPEKFSTAWASLLIAIMGGYQALPSAKPFGQTTLWRGLVYLEGAVLGYLAATRRSG
jgi:hypothetical protein